MDVETRKSLEELRREVQRDRRRLDAKRLGLMYLFQPDGHPARQQIWRDYSGYQEGCRGWFEPGRWLCGFATPNEDQSDVEYCDVFFDTWGEKGFEKFKEHACEIASLLEDAGYQATQFAPRTATLAEALFQLSRKSKTLEWEENEEPGHPETKSRIARLNDVYDQTESLLACVLETSSPAGRKKRPAHRPSDTNPAADAKIGNAWIRGRNSGEFHRYADLADVLKRDVAEVKAAADRDRHRRPDVWAARKRTPRRKKSVKSE